MSHITQNSESSDINSGLQIYTYIPVSNHSHMKLDRKNQSLEPPSPNTEGMRSWVTPPKILTTTWAQSGISIVTIY